MATRAFSILTLALLFQLPAIAQIKAGDVLWQLDAAAAKQRPAPEHVKWVAEGPDGELCIRIDAPPSDGPSFAAASIPIDLRPWRGMTISLRCMAKAEGVTKPPQRYNGVKCMLHYKSPSQGDIYRNPVGIHGTFDWRELTVSASITEDATDGELILGLQDSSGTVWIADVTISALTKKVSRPEKYAGYTPPPPSERLRGVMSPNEYRPGLFEDLAKLKINAVRWQICRNWGQVGTDRDLDEYDKWITEELEDLDKALADARRLGIKVMIDLHSPPGGRLQDSSLAIAMEKPYQDHFVKVWQRLARRYKDHPAVWGYDLINEPFQPRASPEGVADWLGVQVLAGKAIREIDPDTPIIIESDGSAGAHRYAFMEPVPLENVIYQAHMYFPQTYTHQGVYEPWGEAAPENVIAYPGEFNGKPFNRQALVDHLQPLRDFQLAYGVPVVIGEFSAIRWAPGADRYLADVTSIFEEYGWDWTYHAFREWQGWDIEMEDLPHDYRQGTPAKEPTKRAQVLMHWWAKNQPQRGDASP